MSASPHTAVGTPGADTRHAPDRRVATARASTSAGIAVAPLAILLVVGLGLVALGSLWARDRGHTWAAPSWRPREFVPLGPVRPAPPVRELRVVPVNPRCPHCRGHLARAVAEGRDLAGVEVEALIVDTPRRPEAGTFAGIGADGRWWDAHDTWRRRWGHRVYGEVMRFDGAGRYRGTMPPRAGVAP